LTGVSDKEQIENRLLDEALAVYWSFKAGKCAGDDLAKALKRLTDSGSERRKSGYRRKIDTETGCGSGTDSPAVAYQIQR
jgi:hypothetical protein